MKFRDNLSLFGFACRDIIILSLVIFNFSTLALMANIENLATGCDGGLLFSCFASLVEMNVLVPYDENLQLLLLVRSKRNSQR